jgi:hypothetical protein
MDSRTSVRGRANPCGIQPRTLNSVPQIVGTDHIIECSEEKLTVCRHDGRRRWSLGEIVVSMVAISISSTREEVTPLPATSAARFRPANKEVTIQAIQNPTISVFHLLPIRLLHFSVRSTRTSHWRALSYLQEFLKIGREKQPCYPMSNNSTSPAYVPDPSGRGTIGLLSTCFVTLSLCVWTAIHMNIDPSRSPSVRLMKKLLWALLATLAPEVVLWRAWSQLEAARKLCSKMNADEESLIDRSNDPSNATGILVSPETGSQNWSLRLGFFAVMGGYKVIVKEDDRSLFDSGRTATPRGILFLTRTKQTIPHVADEVIKDKSKSDSFAKAIVCVQATWMLLQTLARPLQHLPVTLLEVNTLAHVVAAVIMYGLWWYKPQNVGVREQVEIQPDVAAIMSPSFLKLRQYFVITDPENRKDKEDGTQDTSPLKTGESSKQATEISRELPGGLDEREGWEESVPEKETTRSIFGDAWSLGRWTDQEWLLMVPDPVNPRVTKRMPWRGAVYKARRIEQAWNRNGVIMVLPGQQLRGTIFTCIKAPIHLTLTDIERLDFMSSLEKHPLLGAYVRNVSLWESLGTCLADSAPNMLIPGGLESSLNWGFCGLAVLGALYAGAHAFAWNSHFPTPIERSLWRVSVCIIAGGGIGVWLVVIVSQLETNPAFFTCYLLLWVVPILYVLARAFIIIEAFISVRSLPAGAYDTISWANFMPHVSI